jgi:hypothetical protein
MPGQMSWKKPGRVDHLAVIGGGPMHNYKRERDSDGNTIWYRASGFPDGTVWRDEAMTTAELLAVLAESLGD